MAGSLLAAAIGAGASLLGGKMQSDAAKAAAKQQQKAISQGITESQPYFEQGQNYLKPYIGAGTDSLGIINDIQGLNGPEAQAKALEMYKSNPSAALLTDVNNEAVRKTIGAHAADGSGNSGSATVDLAQRLSANTLNDYYNWQNLSSGLVNTGANAAGAGANLSQNYGDTILNARTGQGTAAASGTVGASNAQVGGMMGATNWLSYLSGQNGNDLTKAISPASTPR